MSDVLLVVRALAESTRMIKMFAVSDWPLGSSARTCIGRLTYNGVLEISPSSLFAPTNRRRSIYGWKAS